jgi:CheY-like chemotaxis protein
VKRVAAVHGNQRLSSHVGICYHGLPRIQIRSNHSLYRKQMRKKILFVDDDPVFHYLYSKTVNHLRIDCELRMALNGKDALAIISGDQQNLFIPDYLFVDLNMPVMDGFRFIESFYGLEMPGRKNTKIIILTSSNNCDDRSRAVGLGIEKYVIKPIKIPDLLTILQAS